MSHDPLRRRDIDRYTPAERAIGYAKLAVEALPADERLTRAVDLLDRAQESVADYVDGVSFLERFGMYQAGRDRVQERKDYITNCAVRLKDVEGKTVAEWPLATLPDFPAELPYSVEWMGKFYRLGAATAAGLAGASTHGKQYEMVFGETPESDPLRDYERGQGPHKLPSES